MIETYMTTVYDKMDNTDRITLVDEAISLLLEYTDCSLVSKDTDGSTYYTCVINAGGNCGYEFSLIGSGKFSLRVRRGIISDSEFISRESQQINDLGQRTDTYSQYAILRIINGGALWSLRFRLFRSYGMYGGSYVYIQARTSKLISGISNDVILTEHVDDSNSLTNYLSNEYGGIVNNDYKLLAITQAYSQMNVDPNDIILFPSLLYLEKSIGNGLGAPTIGGEIPYYIGKPSGVTLNPFTEFQVNGRRYISLGNIAIRSE